MSAAGKASALLLAASAFLWALPAGAAPVKTAKAACTLAKARAAALGRFPVSAIAFCDIIPADSSPNGYYVMALHGRRHCGGICSTNMGWFAVEKATGRLFEWDVGEQKLGPLVTANRFR